MESIAQKTELDQREWLEARKHSVGSSDAGIILGLNPFKSPYTLWAEKSGLLEEEPQPENEAIEFGNLLEPYISKLYERRTARKLQDLGRTTIQKNPLFPWAHSTIDRLIIDTDYIGIAEMKSTGGWAAAKWEEEAPLLAQVQLQHQMAVGVDGKPVTWGSICGLIGGFRFQFRYQDIDRNEDFIKLLMEREAEFWERVKSGNPPEADGSESTAETIKDLYREQVGTSVALPGIAIEWDARLVEIGAAIKTLEEEESELKNKIKAEIKDASKGILPNGAAYTFKTQSRSAYTVAAAEFRVLRRVKAKEK